MAETSVVLRRAWGREVVVALFSTMAVLGIGVLIKARQFDDFADALGGGQWAVWACRGVGVMFALEFSADALGALWRLIDRRPYIEADRAGLRFHPSLHASPVAWSEVREVKISAGALEIAFHRRFWSLEAWATGRRLRIWKTGLDLTLEGAARVAERMEAWRAAA